MDGIAAVEAALKRSGQTILSASRVSPSLEDVFLDVVERVSAESAA